MTILILINDAPYGSEKAYNALRLAVNILKGKPENQVNLFLMGDAAACAVPNQKTPNGYYNIERMISIVLSKGGKIKVCGSCLEARGLKALPLIEGVHPSNMNKLTEWTLAADKTLVF